MFVVGRGVPDHIQNLPETFLNTPFGMMMKPYIDGMLRGQTRGPEIQVVPPEDNESHNSRPTRET